MAQDNNSYGSNPKPTEYVKAWGKIANIADPDNSGRVQVRFIGMEGNEGTIPDDGLAWYDTEIQGSQVKGIGASHKYSVGSYVKLENVGGKWTVTGAGTSSGEQSGSSDTVNTKDGGYPKSARKSSPGLEDLKLNMKGKDLLGDLSKAVNFTSSSLLKYAIDEANGRAGKFKDLPNIGAFDFDSAPDPIAAIKALDPGNLSGSIKTALNMVNNFQTSPLGPISKMVGQGSLMGALSQLQGMFGPVGLLADAAKAVSSVTGALGNISGLVQNLNPQSLLQNASLIENLPNMLSNPALNLPTDLRSSVASVTQAVSVSLAAGDTAGAMAKMSQLTSSISAVTNQIAPLASSLANTPINPLSVADLAKDFAGQLTKIEIPKMPEIGVGKASFPKIPTFDQEQNMIAQATSAALSSAMSSAQALAKNPIAAAVSTATSVVSSIAGKNPGTTMT